MKTVAQVHRKPVVNWHRGKMKNITWLRNLSTKAKNWCRINLGVTANYAVQGKTINSLHSQNTSLVQTHPDLGRIWRINEIWKIWPYWIKWSMKAHILVRRFKIRIKFSVKGLMLILGTTVNSLRIRIIRRSNWSLEISIRTQNLDLLIRWLVQHNALIADTSNPNTQVHSQMVKSNLHYKQVLSVVSCTEEMTLSTREWAFTVKM